MIAFKYGATLYSFDCIIVPFLLISEIQKSCVTMLGERDTLFTNRKSTEIPRNQLFQYNILKFKVFVTLSVNVVLMISLSGVVSKDSY